jgi:hypothetical protein
MLCQYSTRRLVSSGKRDRALNPGAGDGGGDASDVATGTVIVGCSCALSESLTASTRRAHATHVWRSRSYERWSVADMRLYCPASDRHEVTRVCIPPRDAHQFVKNVSCMMMYWLGISLLPGEAGGVFYKMAADPPHIRDGVVGRATRAGRDPRRKRAGKDDDAMDARGLHGFGEGHRQEDGGHAHHVKGVGIPRRAGPQ